MDDSSTTCRTAAGTSVWVLEVATTILGLAGYANALWGFFVRGRITAAHLPADLTTTPLDPRLLLAVGLRTFGFAVVVLSIICFAAYFAIKSGWTSRRWLVAGDVGQRGRGVHARRARRADDRRPLHPRAPAASCSGLGPRAALRSVLPAEWAVAVFVVALARGRRGTRVVRGGRA